MPAPGAGVCVVCRGPAGAHRGVCFACRVVARRLGLPLVPVLPARLCPIPSALYTMLLGYKESAVAEERHRLGALVRALCGRFLADAGCELAAVAGGGIEVVVPVPSTVRAGPPPLARICGLGSDVARALRGAAWVPDALERPRSDARRRPAHMAPDLRGFVVRTGDRRLSVEGRRVLVLDDLYVSGSRAQSAAAALRLAGARSVVVAPLGRVLRPDRVPAHRVFLARHARAAAGDRDVPRGDVVSRPATGSPGTRRAGPPTQRRRRTARG